MASRKTRTAFNRKIIAVAVASCFSSQFACANPTGPQVVNGVVGFTRPNVSTLNVTNSPGAIVNWQGFSIGASEVTRFLQQSASSAVLNRVVGGNISQIQGQLLSNGRVFLINPSGIVVGPGAVIDTAGFVGSTLNMLDADFLAGKLKFQGDGTSGSIINQGWIKTASGGQVILVAPQIENSGLIETPGGQIILAAGKSLTIASLDLEGVQFEVQAPTDAVVNIGKLLAEGGAIGVFAGTLRHSGDIRATSLSTDAMGQIVLRASSNVELAAGSVTSASGVAGGKVQILSGDTTLVSGTIEAKGIPSPLMGEGEGGGVGKGGTIHILGNKVGFIDSARVDASGDTGGGTVLVGGDFQGKNPAIQTAYRTYFGPDATISADAISTGNGGKVILWSDDATRAYGTISARGGSQSGNGGLVEVSGKQYLDFSGVVNTSAPNGATGHLLLDPADLTITTTADAFNGGSFTGGVFGGATAPATITWSTIDTQLAGNNVVITTQGSAAGNLGNITVANASPTLTRANALWFVANNDVNVNGAITNSGSGDIRLYAGWNGSLFTFPTVPTLTNGTGTVSITQNITSGGNITLSAGKDVSVSSSTIQTNGSAGDISLLAAGGNINVLSSTVKATPGLNATVTLNAGQGITVNNSTISAGDVLSSSNVRTVALTAVNGITISNGSTIAAYGSASGTTAANVTLNSTGPGSAVNISGSTIQARAIEGTAAVNISAAGGITVDAFSDVFSSASSGASLALTSSGGNILVTGGLSASTSSNLGQIGITATNGTVTIGDATGGPNVTAGSNDSATITINAANGISVGFGTFMQTEAPDQATVSLSTTNPGAGISVSNSTISANGTSGAVPGHKGSLSMVAGGNITVDNSTVEAIGGFATSSGITGADATLLLQAGGQITVQNSSDVTASAGAGNNANGGAASVTLTATNGGITVSGVSVSAAGGFAISGAAAAGGAASTTLTATNGNITLSNSASVDATGGDGRSPGGAGTTRLTANNGGISANTGSISAKGGNALEPAAPNGNATLVMVADNSIVLGDVSAPSITATAGTGFGICTVFPCPQTFGNAIVAGVSNSGNIQSSANMTADGGAGTATIGAGSVSGSIVLSALNGFILPAIVGSGALSVVHGSFGGLVSLAARDGIGATANPVRIQDGSAFVTATNAASGGSGNIVLSQVTGDVDLGSLTLTNSVAGGGVDITAEAGSINLVSSSFSNPNGSVTLRSQLATTGGISIDSTSSLASGGAGTITLIADSMNIQGPVTAAGGTGNVIAQTFTTGRPIELGNISDPATAMALSDFELSRFSSGLLTIGTATGNVVTVTGPITLPSNVSVTSLAGTGNVTLGAFSVTAGFDNSSTTYSGVMSGTGGLTKTGTGTLTLSGANTYTGTTTVNAGTLQLNGGAAIADTSAVNLAASGAGLTLGASETIGSLTGVAGTTVALGANTLTVGDASSTTFAGVAGGTGGLTKAGAGTLALSGANTYTGTTTITAGTLQLNGGAAIIDSGAVNLSASGASLSLGASETIGSLTGVAGTTVALGGNTLMVGDASSTTFAGAMGGTGGLTKQGAGTLTLSGANTYTGTTTVNAGTLSTFGGAAIADSSAVVMGGGILSLITDETVGSLAGTSNVALGANTLTAGGNNTSTLYSGVISGTGGLAKQGTGTLTLSGVNTYTGTTTVNAGTVVLNGGAAIVDTGAVNLAASGAGLTLGASETIGSLAGVVGTTVALGGNTLTVGDASSTTFAGVMGGTGGLTKQGTGTLTLSGGNTYTGTTTVNAGTLGLSGGGAIADTGAVNLAASGAGLTLGASETIGSLAGVAGTTVTLGSSTLTVGDASSTNFAGVTSGTGGVTKQGTGTLTLSGANTYTGTTTINAGTLAVAGGSLGGPLINMSAVSLNGATIAGLFTNSGTANVTGSSTASGGVQQSGTLNLSGGQTLTVGGAGFDWQGGTLAGTGSLAVSGGAPFTITTGATHTLNGPAISMETLDLTGGNLDLQSGTVNVLLDINVGSGTTLATGGTAINAPSATMNVSGIFQAGTGSITVGNTNILAGGLLKGSGTVTSNVTNNGIVAPGASPGILTISGNYTQGSTGVLNMEIGGTTPGAQFDQLVVSGTATLGGTLNTTLINGFAPAPTDSFTLIQAASLTGTFASTNFPSGSFLAPAYLSSSFVVSAPPTGLVGPGATQSVLVEDQTLRDAVANGPESPQDDPQKLPAPICN